MLYNQKNQMKKFAVIVAGGNGSRMGSSLPKQFLHLYDTPVLLHTLRAFTDAFSDIQIILVLPESYLEYTKEIIAKHQFSHPIQYVIGGATRFHSVQNGLKTITESGIVFVHDAVRCLVMPALIQRCYQQAIEKGSAIPVIPMKDSVRSVTDADQHKIVDRSVLRLVQTPQTFQTEILLPAFESEYSDAFTDEATVVESSGNKVYLIEGEESNIKITSPIDLMIAEAELSKRSKQNKNT
jgi:2-C-methyl-D-erythritol 4-phosphate cytidylyltransferase